MKNGEVVRASDPRYAEVLEYLYREAELLDGGEFNEWLELLADDVRYRMPVRLNRGRKAKPDYSDKTEIFSENLASLRLRVRRLGTDYAWAEIPASRTRHMVSNVRVWTTPVPGELAVASNVLVYRNRLSSASADVLSGERRDVLRKVDGQLRLAQRTILLDQVVVGSRNLSIFF